MDRCLMRIVCVLVLLLVTACGDGDTPDTQATDAKPLIVTSFAPLTWIAHELGGDAVDVACAMGATQDPGHDAPTRDAIQQLQRAALILLNGAGYEQWLGAVNLPRSRVVRTTNSIDNLITLKGQTHAHGNGSAHAHGKVDPHTWLDPLSLKQQAESVTLALLALLPDHDAPGAMATLAKQLEDVAAQYRALGSVPSGDVLVAAYPAFNYLARRYGWPIENMDWTPGVDLTEQDITTLRTKLGDKRARYVLWSETPSPATTKRLQAAGFTSLILNTGTTLPPNTSFLDVLTQNAITLKPAFTN